MTSGVASAAATTVVSRHAAPRRLRVAVSGPGWYRLRHQPPQPTAAPADHDQHNGQRHDRTPQAETAAIAASAAAARIRRQRGR